MRKFFLAILMALPLMAAAQDNTWERIEQEPEEVQATTSKYLVKDAVPVVDGMVCWTKTISAPGKSAQQIYDILHKQLEKMIKEPNQIEGSAIIVDDTEKQDGFVRRHLPRRTFRAERYKLSQIRLERHDALYDL